MNQRQAMTATKEGHAHQVVCPELLKRSDGQGGAGLKVDLGALDKGAPAPGTGLTQKYFRTAIVSDCWLSPSEDIVRLLFLFHQAHGCVGDKLFTF